MFCKTLGHKKSLPLKRCWVQMIAGMVERLTCIFAVDVWTTRCCFDHWSKRITLNLMWRAREPSACFTNKKWKYHKYLAWFFKSCFILTGFRVEDNKGWCVNGSEKFVSHFNSCTTYRQGLMWIIIVNTFFFSFLKWSPWKIWFTLSTYCSSSSYRCDQPVF